MMFDPQTPIGDIVLNQPKAMAVFESLNLDYCCGGQRTLAQACAHAGLDLGDVLARLEGPVPEGSAADPAVWQDATLTALADHIEATHHAFTRAELDRIAPLLAKVLGVHGDRHPELARVDVLFQALAGELGPHLDKEERILFPYIRGLEAGAATPGCFGTIQNPIRVMLAEHDRAGDILRELRALTGDYTAPGDACGSYRSLYLALSGLEEDLHLHIYLENHLLFPRAIALEGAPVEA